MTLIREVSTCVDANYGKGDWPNSKRDRTLIPECGRFRRLTPVECERLQGWSDDHTAIGLYNIKGEYVLRPVSDTQRYRMTGNGVTADVVREVVKKMIKVGCFA